MTIHKAAPEHLADGTLDQVTGGAGAGASGDVADQTATKDAKAYGIALSERTDTFDASPKLMSAPDE